MWQRAIILTPRGYRGWPCRVSLSPRDRLVDFGWEFWDQRGYVPVPILILIYAYLLQRELPDVARGLTIGWAFWWPRWGRVGRMNRCAYTMGTHFLWHI